MIQDINKQNKPKTNNMIPKYKIEKAANNYALLNYGVSTITCTETKFNDAEEDFIAGAEFAFEKVQEVTCMFVNWLGLNCYWFGEKRWMYKNNVYTTDQLFEMYLEEIKDIPESNNEPKMI